MARARSRTIRLAGASAFPALPCLNAALPSGRSPPSSSPGSSPALLHRPCSASALIPSWPPAIRANAAARPSILGCYGKGTGPFLGRGGNVHLHRTVQLPMSWHAIHAIHAASASCWMCNVHGAPTSTASQPSGYRHRRDRVSLTSGPRRNESSCAMAAAIRSATSSGCAASVSCAISTMRGSSLKSGMGCRKGKYRHKTGSAACVQRPSSTASRHSSRFRNSGLTA